MNRRRFRLMLVLLVAVGAGGCACVGSNAGPRSPAHSGWLRAELYFGAAQPDGRAVDDAQWQAFVDQRITPVFPDGFTVMHAHGQYRMADGTIVREPSRVLVVLYKGGDRDQAERRLHDLAAAYATQFEQESLLLSITPAGVAFVGQGDAEESSGGDGEGGAVEIR